MSLHLTPQPEAAPTPRYHGVDEAMSDFLEGEITKALLQPAGAGSKPIPQVQQVKTKRQRRSDYSDLGAWTEHERALERIYDARRRDCKRREGEHLSIEERRAARYHPMMSSDRVLETAVLAIQAAAMTSGNSVPVIPGSALADLDRHLRERLATLS